MSGKEDEALKSRLTQLSQDAMHEATVAVNAVVLDAAHRNALGDSQLAKSVTLAIETSASELLTKALASLDKIGGRHSRAKLVRASMDEFFASVTELGKQGPSFAGSRDDLIDRFNEEARARMHRQIDTHLGGWNDFKEPWHVRHSFAWEWIKIALGGAVGFASGIGVMLIKERWLGG